MKIKATKTLASVLNKNIKEYQINLVKLNDKQFSYYVDIDIYNHDIDYDYTTNKFNVIEIIYPFEYYANNRYITTKELTKIFNKSDKTLNGFIDAFKSYVEV